MGCTVISGMVSGLDCCDQGTTPGTGGGFVFHSGAGIPPSGLGNDDDLYIDFDTADVYKKISGIWTLQGNVGGAGVDASTYNLEADESISQGQPVFINVSGHAELAQADAPPRIRVSGFAFESIAVGSVGKVISEGRIVLTDWTPIIGSTFLTPGIEYWLDAANPGKLTQAIPTTGYVINMGKAVAPNIFDIEINNPIQL